MTAVAVNGAPAQAGAARPGDGASTGAAAGEADRPASEQVVLEAFRVARTLGSADRSIGGPPRAWLLHKLAQSPGIRVADLADGCGLDASTTSRHVRTLEDAGLLTREGDPDDRRAARLSLTRAGQDALDAALRVRAELLSRATAHWSAADQRRLAQLLSRLSGDLVAAGLPDPLSSKGTSTG